MGRQVVSERVAGLEQGDPVGVESWFGGGAADVRAGQCERPHLVSETAQLLHDALQAREVVHGGCPLLEQRGSRKSVTLADYV